MTEFTVLYNPSKRKNAQEITKFGAIDILYECPKCGKERVATWLFPDVDMMFQDECCGMQVHFEGKEEE